MAQEIDAVFTWVDGADASFVASKALHAARWTTRTPPGWEKRSSYTGAAEARERPVLASHSQARFRNKDELRFALRSIDQHAPWIRRIYIVTNGQSPAWLDVNHPRIAIVPHDRLFEDAGCLPTFNSNAIESTIHRIPGLSDDFIYFNDDFFLGRPVKLSDFVDDQGRHRLFVEAGRKMPRDMTDRSMIAHSWAFNHALLNDRVAISTSRKMFAHTPQIYNKHVLAEIQLVWREHFERTRRNRFRTAFDAAFRLLYTGYAGEKQRAVISKGDTKSFGVITAVNDDTYSFIKVGDPQSDFRALMAETQRRKPTFFCVNDELPDGATGQEEAAMALLTRNFLLRFYPNASPFELTDLSSADIEASPYISEVVYDPRVRYATGNLSGDRPLTVSSRGFVPDPRGGWHPAEEEGVWSCGPHGRLHLAADPRGPGLFVIRLRCRVIGSELPGGRLLRMAIQLGNDVAGARVTEMSVPTDEFVTIEARAPAPPPGWSGEILLFLDRLIAPSPTRLGHARDDRFLGIYLKEITLAPAAAEQVEEEGDLTTADLANSND